ncbi:hypothetical protein PHG11b_30 [Flavobacterium phage 11b]|uniref:hypothetical protein n=1 Tax=Flavobacterium phage 11b TaxID=294631 RepID=UPI000044413C|nr:hypothetical protein PHG11b_30 [Flavobacterium phage 11b]CAH56657.1 hypothetical protein PHG11b_30 [Flavobacterium phage 11b]
MSIYNFPDHIKGDTFRTKQIVLNFDITGADIKMQFKVQGVNAVVFSFLTSDATISIIDAATGTIRMNSRILNENVNNYVYDFQFTDSLGNVTTYFSGSLKITQDITT